MSDTEVPQIKNTQEKRCHTCKETKSLDRFYVTKAGRINTFKCKKCYKQEFLELIKEVPL